MSWWFFFCPCRPKLSLISLGSFLFERRILWVCYGNLTFHFSVIAIFTTLSALFSFVYLHNSLSQFCSNLSFSLFTLFVYIILFTNCPPTPSFSCSLHLSTPFFYSSDTLTPPPTSAPPPVLSSHSRQTGRVRPLQNYVFTSLLHHGVGSSSAALLSLKVLSLTALFTQAASRNLLLFTLSAIFSSGLSHLTSYSSTSP